VGHIDIAAKIAAEIFIENVESVHHVRFETSVLDESLARYLRMRGRLSAPRDNEKSIEKRDDANAEERFCARFT
jgi:hypothetical protein